jgi:hypothetical protein
MIINTLIPAFELAELNTRLVTYYGQSLEGLPNYRVVWSEDQFEKRRMTHTDSGIQLIAPEVREVRKYKQWVQEKYILEKLTIISEMGETDLVEKLSYEPLFVFEDKNGNALKPVWSAIYFIMENIMHNMESKGYVKYKDPDGSQEEAIENKKARVDGLVADLFGNESPVGTALAHKEAVVVPNKEFS